MPRLIHCFRVFALSALCCCSSAVLAHGGKAHVHGVGKLQVAVEGDTLSLRLEAPLHDLVGFEHPPRTDRQRAAAKQTLDRFQQGDTLFVPTAAAQCRPVSTHIEAPVLQTGAQSPDGHADLVAEYRFQCAQPDKLTGLEVRVSTHFRGLRRIDAEVISARGQQAVRLTARQNRLNW